MVKFKVEEGITPPVTQTNQIDLIAYSIIKAFKGDTEVIGEKLEKIKKGFQERGYIKLRPFERIQFKTGLNVDYLESGLGLKILSDNTLSVTKGLLAINADALNDKDEIIVTLYNSTPFLTTVNKADCIASLLFLDLFRPKIMTHVKEF